MTAPKLKVHPVADLFPMLGEEDLQELANSIAEEGLLDPIVLDADGRILDGRNRYAACKLAKVEPDFVTYEGDDPDTYALIVNIARRHLSKGQQAMTAAKFFSLNEKRGGIKAMAAAVGVSLGYIGQAAIVLEWAPELADDVSAGASLNEAYNFAHERKVEADDAERTAAERQDREARTEARRLEQLEAAREQVRQTAEAIGPAVAIRPLPLRDAEEEPEITESSNGDALRDMKAHLDELIAIRERLYRFKPPEVIEGELYGPSVYSALTHIIEAAVSIAEQHDIVLTESKQLRSLK